MHRTLAAPAGDVNAPRGRICFSFTFWTPLRQSRAGPDTPNGHRGCPEPRNPAPALRRRSGQALELQEIEPATAAVHRVDDAVGGHVDVVDLGRAGARTR